LLGTLNVHAAQTNLVQSLRFNLSVYLQGTTATNGNIINDSISPEKISTTDIIQAIGTSQAATFSTDATLQTVTQLPGGPTRVVIQGGTNRVDASGFFIFTKDTIAVAKGFFNTTMGAERGMEYVNRSFRLRNQGGFPNLTLNFRVSGLSPTKCGSLFDGQGAVIGVAEEYVLSVVGTAQVDGADAIARGTVANTGRRVETVP
jgi:hypothetical protein